ncbi:MAG: RND transporter [SAR86 cluster bacterium]|uniref:RND transporter n=1 Tax=SAR86 cluster bacterium TaxID=2030880 RepID=A0A2A4X2Z3_9GAMM|nr:MAG: RND transporter [SAR86 cluster bacterium]
MTALIKAWANFTIAYRLPIIAGSIALLLVALLTGKNIPFDNSTERYFVAGDPTLLEYDNLIDLFGDNEYLIVGFEATPGESDIFNADTLRDIARVSDFLEYHEYVTQLRSITNFQFIHGDGDDLRTDYLIEDVEGLIGDAAAIANTKTILNNETLALDTLITRDFRHTRVAARVEYTDETSESKVQLVQDLYRFVEEENLSSDSYILHLSGYPLAQERFETVSAEDIAVLIPVMVALMVLILFFSFRSLWATIAPWLVIACGILLVQEIQGYIGIPHSTVDSGALAPTLIIIGIGITVHILLEFFNYMRAGFDGVEAARSTIINIWRPAFFTAITTAAGFFALSITKILPVREFAFLGAIGSIILFLFALTVLPAVLSFMKKIPSNTIRVLDAGFISKITQKVPDFTLRNRNRILLGGLAALLFSIWNIPNIIIDSNYVTLFKESSQTRQDIEYFDDVYRGMMNLDIILDSGEEEGIKDPVFLVQLDEIETWLQQRETLGPINSMADYLKEINQALNGDDPEFYRLPSSREMTAQFLLLYESSGANEDLSDIKDFENRHARLVVPVVNMQASEMQAELESIEAYLDENYPRLQAVITGTMALYTVQDTYISEGMALSFLIALGVITLFFITLFKSVKYGLLSIIPSVLPIVLAGSFAGWLGISLDQSAVIVFAMTMGIAVDDAIHVMSRYLLAKSEGASTKQSIARAMNESGRAVVYSSIVLVFGFSVLCFASFTTIIYVGLFGSIIMTLALVGDLVMLPAILYWVDGNEDSEDAKLAPAT